MVVHHKTVAENWDSKAPSFGFFKKELVSYYFIKNLSASLHQLLTNFSIDVAGMSYEKLFDVTK